MKSYINARLESIDASVDLAIDNAIANAGHMEMELIWENAAPTSTFGEQYLPLEASKEYDAIIVTATESTSTATSINTWGYPNIYTRMMMFYNNRQHRGFNFDKANGQIYFGTAYNGAYNSTVSTDAGALIPTHIYGIKGVK